MYETFKDTNSHGLVSLQFLCAHGIFFGGDKSIPKSAILELYKNLSYETLSGARDLDFQAFSDLILEKDLQVERSTLLNRKRKDEDNESNLKIKDKRDFFERPDQFVEELVEELFKPLEHKKMKISLLNKKFRMLKQQKKKQRKRTINSLISNKNLMRQKMLHLIKTKTKQNDLINLVDDVLNENNPFNNKIKAENIYIEDNFFDD